MCDGFFELEELPKKVVVVGAGYIAVELAGVLNALGSETHLVVRKGKALRNFDNEVSDFLDKEIVSRLKTVYDPEIPVDIYELGLIYKVDIDEDNNVNIKMTLTSPACPVAGSLPGEVKDRVASIEELNDVKVELVWDPPWSPEKMSDEARLELGML